MFLGDISFIFMNHHIYSTWHLLGYQHTYPIPISITCWNIIFIKCCLCKRKDTKVGVDYIAVCAFPSAWSFINRSKQKWFFTSITKILMHLWIINSWLAQGNYMKFHRMKDLSQGLYFILLLTSCVSGTEELTNMTWKSLVVIKVYNGLNCVVKILNMHPLSCTFIY